LFRAVLINTLHATLEDTEKAFDCVCMDAFWLRTYNDDGSRTTKHKRWKHRLMNLSILHISDLHRDRNNPLRNDVLLNSLYNDCRHFSVEQEPKVRAPDLIIVSGDIIQGIKFDVEDPEKCLREQYREASEFLIKLSDRFVGGDRERVVIVPGNHDISAYHLHKSLELVDILSDRKKDLINELFRPQSLLRWSWEDLKLYKIADDEIYRQRMAAFAEFYSTFYDGKRIYDLDPAKQIDVFDYPEYELTVVGFSSCYNNDLMNRQAAIHPCCIAEADEILSQPSYASRIRMAIWHHNTEGSPMLSDYMDSDLIQNLIDRGFTLGLHGHQHRPQFLDTRFRHGVDRKITVISAGTLCGGASFRHGRAYNVVELNTAERTGRLHVREMQNDNLLLPIWGQRSLPPNICPYLDFEYESPPPQSIQHNSATVVLIEAQKLHNAGKYEEAAEVIISVVQSDELARPLLLDCLIRLKDVDRLLAYFDPPASDAEAIHVMDALWSGGKRERLLELISLPIIAESDDPSVIEIRKKYSVRLK